MTNNSNNASVADFAGRTVVDPAGDKVGTVFDVYLDNDTNQPEWLAVSTGMFGSKISFVPIEGAGFDGDDNVIIAYDKGLVKDAPRAEADGQLSEEEERALYAHYGRSYQQSGVQDVQPTVPAPAPTARVGSTERVTPTDDTASMVRSEEELSIDKHTREAGRVKLRKWVETDEVQLTVPVQRQMARVVRENVSGSDTDGIGEFVEGEEEIVLSEETVDVNKRVVAKERVGLETETVTEQVPVSETVRKERIGVEGDLVDEREIGDRR